MKINKSTLLEFIGDMAFNLASNSVYQFVGFIFSVASASLLSGLLLLTSDFVPYFWGKVAYAVVIAFSVYMARSYYLDLKDSGALSLK